MDSSKAQSSWGKHSRGSEMFLINLTSAILNFSYEKVD